ncbi:MAG TPA: hypothetical protein PKD53_26945 [Chloroflexaceae bacterium]|nr:hypothetical protein [Chloroflexaceae bacterium]
MDASFTVRRAGSADIAAVVALSNTLFQEDSGKRDPLMNHDWAKQHGQRLRFAAAVRSERVANWAGLWMRIDGPGNRTLGFDNMQGRPIQGTRDWERHAIVLDVPPESEVISIAFCWMVQVRCGSLRSRSRSSAQTSRSQVPSFCRTVQ